MGKDKLIQELFQKIEILTSRLEQAEKEISELKAENAELKARLNSNSKNSSRPPSSDGYRKKPAFPKKESKEVSAVTKAARYTKLKILIKL